MIILSKICDLHTHSIFSDGTFTPEETIDLAIETGLSAVALTDHNTVAGLSRFISYAKNKAIDVVPGIEFTTGYNGQELHILGLFVKPDSFDVITDYVKSADRLKDKSNTDLIINLNSNGYDINYQEIKSATPGGKVNRAHIAAELLKKGYVESIEKAFKTILSPQHGWYKPPERLSALKTIELIKELGAVPVWAHPLINMNYEECDAFLPIAKEHGLAGIETVYSLYNEEDSAFAKKMCEKYNLLQSGGSDFHGTVKPDISLGKGKGSLEIPYEFYEKLRETAE